MKKLILIIALLLFGSTAQATLIDNLDGTVTQNRVDGSTLMWLMDANRAMTSGYDADGKMTWDESHNWIASLNSSSYLGYNDWRLPSAFNLDGSPPTGPSYNSDSEMGYLYYAELGNPTDSAAIIPLISGLFQNMQDDYYWSGTDYPLHEDRAYAFNFESGYQPHESITGDTLYAWAVRDVTPVPEPTTIALLGIGIVGLAGAEVRLRRKKHNVGIVGK